MALLKEDGLLRDDELMEYARLSKRNTGLDIDIFVDDGGAYKRYHHPLWVYVRNGYSDTNPIFHIEVSSTPCAPEITYNLRETDLNAVLVFISKNADLLKSFADEEIEPIILPPEL